VQYNPDTLAQIEDRWPRELEHFSASSAGMMLRCEEQWRQRYVLGKKIPPSAAALIGRTDHKAIEHNFRQKIKSYEDLSMADMLNVTLETFDREMAFEGGPSEIEWDDPDLDVNRQAGMAKDQTVLLVETYHEQVSPNVQPLTVEESFSLAVPGLPVPVIGYIDLVAGIQTDMLGITVNDRIIDRKTVGRKEKEPKPDWLFQAAVYQLARPLPFEWHLTVKTKTPYVMAPAFNPYPPVEGEKAVRMLQMTANRIAYNFHKYGPDNVWPGARYHHPWSCQYCGFRPTCSWWS